MMLFRCPLALFTLTLAALVSEAGPLRWRSQPSYSSPSYQYPTYQTPTYSYPSYQFPTYQQSAVMPAGGYAPAAAPAGGYTAGYTPVVTSGFEQSAWAGAGDGLDEVNAKRAARGLRPFMRDPGLTQAAQACAAYRAQYGLFGHTSNDFGFLPPGTSAGSAGCAAYPASYGWMTCCTYENYMYAGAAYVTGRDGRRYMHLFVR